MNTQDVHEIGGFEDGKGEKLDIKKNNQNPQKNDVYQKNYDFNSNGNSSTRIKAFGYFSLLCLFVFFGLSIGINSKFSAGVVACFVVFLFCVFGSSASDKHQIDNITREQKGLNSNVKNEVCRQNDIEQDGIDNDVRNEKEVRELADKKQSCNDPVFKADLNNFTEYDKNNYDHSAKKNNVMNF